MALIWSKQSTGMPVEVRSAQSETKQLSTCVLDIDIQKNEPRVKVHERIDNTSGLRGTERSAAAAGSQPCSLVPLGLERRDAHLVACLEARKLAKHLCGSTLACPQDL